MAAVVAAEMGRCMSSSCQKKHKKQTTGQVSHRLCSLGESPSLSEHGRNCTCVMCMCHFCTRTHAKRNKVAKRAPAHTSPKRPAFVLECRQCRLWRPAAGCQARTLRARPRRHRTMPAPLPAACVPTFFRVEHARAAAAAAWRKQVSNVDCIQVDHGSAASRLWCTRSHQSTRPLQSPSIRDVPHMRKVRKPGRPAQHSINKGLIRPAVKLAAAQNLATAARRNSQQQQRSTPSNSGRAEACSTPQMPRRAQSPRPQRQTHSDQRRAIGGTLMIAI